jgi:predicted small secreted protein
MTRNTLIILGAVLCTMTVSACENTWHGAGKDVENAGETMQNQYN